jgi:general stress protein 26
MADDDSDRVWELMEKISICMLTTHDGERIRSRSMAAFVRRDEGAIYFLGDEKHHKDEEIELNPNVGLAFADGQKFVSVTGHASVSRPGENEGTVGTVRAGMVGFT